MRWRDSRGDSYGSGTGEGGEGGRGGALGVCRHKDRQSMQAWCECVGVEGGGRVEVAARGSVLRADLSVLRKGLSFTGPSSTQPGQLSKQQTFQEKRNPLAVGLRGRSDTGGVAGLGTRAFDANAAARHTHHTSTHPTHHSALLCPPPHPPPRLTNYRKAAELSKVRGKLSCLVINDLDAGIGRFGNTQVGRFFWGEGG